MFSGEQALVELHDTVSDLFLGIDLGTQIIFKGIDSVLPPPINSGSVKESGVVVPLSELAYSRL